MRSVAELNIFYVLIASSSALASTSKRGSAELILIVIKIRPLINKIRRRIIIRPWNILALIALIEILRIVRVVVPG